MMYLFRRYRLASVLHLLGLSVALAAFYLFQTQVRYNRIIGGIGFLGLLGVLGVLGVL
ncbi:MAG: hypothetical protein IJ253_11940 [Bacteroidaceae bacterium]|nr:hypothetical protein [Bacteroidaceae bacterium]